MPGFAAALAAGLGESSFSLLAAGSLGAGLLVVGLRGVFLETIVGKSSFLKMRT
jgi:hypothetical protein